MLAHNLTLTEELKILRVYWRHSTDVLKDSTDLPQSEIDEHTALQAYIEVRIANLRKLIGG